MFQDPAKAFSSSRHGSPQFLIEPEPWVRVFLRNFGDLFRRRPPYIPAVSQAEFWPDVFVQPRFPWLSFVESAVYHVVFVAALFTWVRLMPHPIQRADPFQKAQFTIFPISRDLPPIDTGRVPAAERKAGDPVDSRQPIISVPPQADNRTQTIITPPDIVLHHDVPMPNIVAWSELPSAPPSALAGMNSQRNISLPGVNVVNPAPQLDAVRTARMQLDQNTAVAPAPDALQLQRDRAFQAPEAAVVEPPPSVDPSIRQAGTINIGRSEVVAPAPQLPVAAQRALNGSGGAPQMSAGVVPPPPSVEAGGGSGSGSGRVIALGLHPVAPTAPFEIPQGNRRGEFAATPTGKPQASGTPEVAGTADPSGKMSGSGGNGDGHGGGSKMGSNLPPGIFVGATENPKGAIADPVGATTVTIERTPIHSPVASLPPPRVEAKRKPATLVDRPVSSAERRVFGNRRFYSMPLNMPNLNSASGSWIIRFAELKNTSGEGVLYAPEATRKFDPAYPAEFQRNNVQGTVTLYAVIHSDGSVGEIQVLDGLQNDLDRYAMEALGRCKFAPAVKNGEPVALEAVVMIPFRLKSAF